LDGDIATAAANGVVHSESVCLRATAEQQKPEYDAADHRIGMFSYTRKLQQLAGTPSQGFRIRDYRSSHKRIPKSEDAEDLASNLVTASRLIGPLPPAVCRVPRQSGSLGPRSTAGRSDDEDIVATSNQRRARDAVSTECGKSETGASPAAVALLFVTWPEKFPMLLISPRRKTFFRTRRSLSVRVYLPRTLRRPTCLRLKSENNK
jgi:hypothetical protein